MTCFNNVQEIGPPMEWKQSKTVLIPKKRKPTTKDLRPIALTNTSYKLYMSLIKQKLVDHLARNKQFSLFQAGFTGGRRLEDNLFILSYCIYDSRKNKKPLFVCAIDFEKAFDSIKRSSIVTALIKYRCDPVIIDVICQLYEDDSTSVYFNNREVGEIEATSGIRQGCTGSPLLFVNVVNFIIDILVQKKIGFRNRDIEVPCLFFADDGLLLAQSVNEMSKLIQVLERGANEVGLKMNRSKSQLLVYGQTIDSDNIEKINITSSIKYLGVEISTERDIFHQHKVGRLNESKRLCNLTYSVIERCCNKIMIGKTYWEVVVLPSLLYGSAVINWSKTEIECLQRSEDDVWRKVLGAPGYAPLVAMRGDVGASTILARDIKSKMKFVKHVVESQSEILNNILAVVMDNGHPFGKIVNKYTDLLNIEQIDSLKEISDGDINRKVDSLVTEDWKNELNQKSTLTIYKQYKEKIYEEKFYDNTFGSILLFRARSNTLKLAWRNRFQGNDVDCKLCGATVETNEHFIMQCPRLAQIRQEFGVDECSIQGILGFERDKDIEKSKRFLRKIWITRKELILQMSNGQG